MSTSSRSLRWLQIILTLFYGQIISSGIYQYFIQGIYGLILHIRPVCDSILLIILSLLMFAFVLYALLALWYCRTRMSIISIIILILIFILTLVKSIIEINSMGQNSIRTEWMTIRIVELVFKIFGIITHIFFVIRLRQGYRPENS